MFFKKKDKVIATKTVHYEGLPNIAQNSSLIASLQLNELVFEIISTASIIKLPIQKITLSEFLTEDDFMARYKNTIKPNTKEVKLYWVLHYKADEITTKQIVFWSFWESFNNPEKLSKAINKLLPSTTTTL